MFSWKKQNPPSQQRQQQQRQEQEGAGDYSDLIAHGMRLANEDIDHGEGDEDVGEEDDGDLDDIDIDDPDLLAELHGLAGEAPVPKPKPAPAPTQPPVKAPASVPSKAQASQAAPATKLPISSSTPVGKPSPSTTPAAPSPSLAGLGVGLQDAMEDDDDEEVELTEDDWKDPHLLAQLQSLGGRDDHHDPKPAATASESKEEQTPRTLPVSKTVPLHATNVALSQVVPTESGPLSPTSNAPPSTLQKPASASTSMIAIPPRDEAVNNEDLDGDSFMAEQPPKETKSLQEISVPSLSPSKPGKRLEPIPKENHKDILKLLQTRDVQYKRAALDAKHAGNMKLAADRVKTFKNIQKWIALVEAGGFLDLELYPIPDEPPTTVAATNPTVSADKTRPSAAPSSSAGPSSARATKSSTMFSPPIGPSAPEVTTQVSNSIAEAYTEDLRNGSNGRGTFGIEFKQLAEDDDFQIVSNSDADTYDMLQSQLESQIKMCTTTCSYYFQAGHKRTALEFQKLNETFKADLVSLQSYRSHGKKAPAFHFQDVRFELELGFYQEISLNDLSLSVVRAWDLSHKDVQPTDIDAYVSWDLGWPTETMAGAGTGKGTTPTVRRTPKPDFNYSKTLGIERTRVFQRFVERRKATFEVWHYRGMLWKDYLVGRAQVPLLPLLYHSEIHEIVPLLDPTTRRNTGGKIEVKIRLQRPLIKPEIVVKEEKWLVIDEFNSAGLGFPAPVAAGTPQARSSTTSAVVAGRAGTPVRRAAKPAAAPTSRPAPVAAVVQTPATPKQSTPIPATATPTTATAPAARPNNPVTASPKVSEPATKTPATKAAVPTATDDLDESESDKALNELNSVEVLVSNMVLESEIQQTQQMVHNAKAVGNSEAAEEHQDRLTQLEIKLKLLVLQVQTGQLTMDVYCQAVNARIVKDKRLAVELKRLGMIPEAMRALARSKIMAQEMKEVEEAMAAQAEEEGEE
ncbi:Coiled-coil and C2 domain-containing protein 1B [Mortierella claussenii]|nr:Coiled-coil and C2 domain-containing protein 1B [Mortierella claussenii]